jgi:putative nucleotidyltransferase with HDIG domain
MRNNFFGCGGRPAKSGQRSDFLRPTGGPAVFSLEFRCSAEELLTGDFARRRLEAWALVHLREEPDERGHAAVAANEQSSAVANLPWAYLHLPPFPQVAVRVLQLAQNENVQLHQLCDLISSDPAFASEVLTVSNSLLYAPRYPSTSIVQAVAVLGANTLQGLCVTVGVRAYLGKAMSYPAMRNLWRHNVACAITAQKLAEGSTLDKEMAYTAGILHDIGRMALALLQPKGYAALLEAHQGNAATMLDVERKLFGWDHCETGRKLITDWKLPEHLEPVVADHHQARRADGKWDVAELVKVSCAMASAVGFTAFPGCEPPKYSDLLNELPAGERFKSDAEVLRQQIADGIHAIESV